MLFKRDYLLKITSSILFFALACYLVSACTGMNSHSEAVAQVNDAPKVSATSNNDVSKIAANIDLPNVSLTDEILFKVLSAEIAFQRADFPAAFATMMSVAQQTHDPRLAKRAMEMALAEKQPGQAFTAARAWREYAPHSDEATQYYLGFMILNNNLKEIGSVMVSKLAAASPKERGLMILETQRLMSRSKDKEAAFKALEELCKPYPELLEARLALAQAAFASNNSARALTEGQQALKISPSSALAALTLAQVSPPAAALKTLADFLIQNPTANEVRRAYAGILIEQKKYTEARQQFEIISKNKPDDATSMYALGVLSLELNQVPKAEQYLKDFVQMAETSSTEKRDPTSAYLYLSQIADDRKDGTAAISWLAKVQSYDGKNTAYFNAQLRRALLIVKYDSLENARKFLHGLKTNTQEQIQVTQLDAELLRGANRETEAIALLQVALKQHPDSPDLLYDFAMAAEKLDRFDEMEKALQRVIKINPQNQQAYNALGYSLVERNIRLTEARTYIEKAYALAPEDAFILDSMGWLAHRERKYETALTYLRRAYQIRPDTDIAVHIGEVLWVMGEQQKAKSMWKEAREKDPQNTTLQNTLKRHKVGF